MYELKQAMLNLEKAKEEYNKQYSKLANEIKEIIQLKFENNSTEHSIIRS